MTWKLNFKNKLPETVARWMQTPYYSLFCGMKLQYYIMTGTRALNQSESSNSGVNNKLT
jgi:hypothetical protein